MTRPARAFEQEKIARILAFRRECHAQRVPSAEIEALTESLADRIDRLRDDRADEAHCAIFDPYNL